MSIFRRRAGESCELAGERNFVPSLNTRSEKGRIRKKDSGNRPPQPRGWLLNPAVGRELGPPHNRTWLRNPYDPPVVPSFEATSLNVTLAFVPIA
jgi:hypothetical protein